LQVAETYELKNSPLKDYGIDQWIKEWIKDHLMEGNGVVVPHFPTNDFGGQQNVKRRAACDECSKFSLSPTE
jgi:hypothetical protein